MSGLKLFHRCSGHVVIIGLIPPSYSRPTSFCHQKEKGKIPQNSQRPDSVHRQYPQTFYVHLLVSFVTMEITTKK